MKAIIFATLLALTAARPSEILSYDAETHSRQETGVAGTAVSGEYSFLGTDGVNYKINYEADDNGYRATGDHLPVAPAVPVIPEAVPVEDAVPAVAAEPDVAPAPVAEDPVPAPVAVDSAPVAVAPQALIRGVPLPLPWWQGQTIVAPAYAEPKEAVKEAPVYTWAAPAPFQTIVYTQPKVELRFQPVKQFGYNIVY